MIDHSWGWAAGAECLRGRKEVRRGGGRQGACLAAHMLKFEFEFGFWFRYIGEQLMNFSLVDAVRQATYATVLRCCPLSPPTTPLACPAACCVPKVSRAWADFNENSIWNSRGRDTATAAEAATNLATQRINFRLTLAGQVTPLASSPPSLSPPVALSVPSPLLCSSAVAAREIGKFDWQNRLVGGQRWRWRTELIAKESRKMEKLENSPNATLFVRPNANPFVSLPSPSNAKQCRATPVTISASFGRLSIFCHSPRRNWAALPALTHDTVTHMPGSSSGSELCPSMR